MKWVPQKHGEMSMVLSMAGEEAAILLQPGELFRTILDGNASWAAGCEFLTPRDSAGGMVAVMPRPALTAWLEAVAAHPVEREFQELLIQHAQPAELPIL
jgi:hypothetical protein